MTIPQPVRGVIQDSGGGQFSVWVERDTESYPAEGMRGEWIARIEDDPQAHIDLLVERGVLKDSCIYINEKRQYGAAIPKRVVRAGYRKTSGGWTFTCSEGCIAGAIWSNPEEVRALCWHFKNAHHGQTVEWDDPPPKVKISYEWEGDLLRYSCSADESGRMRSARSQEKVEDLVLNHVDYFHKGDDVTYDPIPEPPHQHDWRWKFQSDVGRDEPTCETCGLHFRPRHLSGAHYTGPIPNDLQ